MNDKPRARGSCIGRRNQCSRDLPRAKLSRERVVERAVFAFLTVVNAGPIHHQAGLTGMITKEPGAGPGAHVATSGTNGSCSAPGAILEPVRCSTSPAASSRSKRFPGVVKV